MLRGRVGSLLEVGTGFHPELTGRENVYLNGAILGMRRAEIRRKFDEIVEFADVERVHRHAGEALLERDVRAARLRGRRAPRARDPDRRRGARRRRRRVPAEVPREARGRRARRGRTVLFVSHNLQAVSGLCDVAVHLDHGRLVEVADAGSVVRSYLERTALTSPERVWTDGDRPGDAGLRLVAVRVLTADGSLLTSSLAGDDVVVELEVERVSVEAAIAVGFDLEREDGTVVMSSFLPPVDLPVGQSRLRAGIPTGLLNTGRFSVGPRGARSGSGQVFHAAGSVQFEVVTGDVQPLFGLRRQGAVAPPLSWRRVDGET